MGLFKYPYTDLNELNLDWVIAKIKYIEQASHILYDNSGTGLIANNVQDAINEIINLISSQGVATWNGRAGIVVPIAGDYDAQMIDYDNTGSGLAATNSQSAIDELAARPLGGVESFNTRTGAVVPTAGDYDASDVTYDNTGSGLVATETQSAIDEVNSKIPATIVESFNSRTGAVNPSAGDYDASDITYDNTTSGLAATDTQAAIDELDYAIDNFSVAASQVSYDNTQSGLTATDAQAAIDEIANDVLSSGVASFNGRTGAVNPASGDYAISMMSDYSGTPSDGQVMKYDGNSAKWIPGTGGGIPGKYRISQLHFDNTSTSASAQVKLNEAASAALAYIQAMSADYTAEFVAIKFTSSATIPPAAPLVYDNSATSLSLVVSNCRIGTSNTQYTVNEAIAHTTQNSCSRKTFTTNTSGNTSYTDLTNTTLDASHNVEIYFNIYKEVV